MFVPALQKGNARVLGWWKMPTGCGIMQSLQKKGWPRQEGERYVGDHS